VTEVRPTTGFYVYQVEASWRDVLGVLALFLGLPSACFLCFILREWRRLRRERDLDRLEAESLRDEGFSPGPPRPPPSSEPDP